MRKAAIWLFIALIARAAFWGPAILLAQVNSGMAFVNLVPRGQRDVTQREFLQRLQAELSQIPGVLAFASVPSPIGARRRASWSSPAPIRGSIRR